MKGETDTVIILDSVLYGFHRKESGIVTALRYNGEEFLFASRDSGPCRWIPVTEFHVDSKCIIPPDELRKKPWEDE